MNRVLLNAFGAMALVGMLFAVPGCSSDDGEKNTGDGDGKTTESSGTSPGRSSGGGSRGGSRSGGDSQSGGSEESSSASYSFCLNGSGWTCPTPEAKSACVKGSCGKCSKDPSQCEDQGGGGSGGGDGDDGSGGGDDGSGGGDPDDGF